MRVLLALILLFPHFVMAEDFRLGRLFTDAAERRQLDNKRNMLKSARTAVAGSENGSATLEQIAPGSDLVPLQMSEQAPAEVVFSGYLQRADGKNYFWVNGMIDQQLTTGVDQIRDGKVLIRINQNSVNLKPGQIWSDGERIIREGYERVDQTLVTDFLIENATGKPSDDKQTE